jgi:hypothetical protein
MTLTSTDMDTVERLRKNLVSGVNVFNGLVQKERDSRKEGVVTPSVGATLPGYKRYDQQKAALTRLVSVATEIKSVYESDISNPGKPKDDMDMQDTPHGEDNIGVGPRMGVQAPNTTGGSWMGVCLECVVEHAVCMTIEEVFRIWPNLHETADFWQRDPVRIRMTGIFEVHYSPVMQMSYCAFACRVLNLVELKVMQRRAEASMV